MATESAEDLQAFYRRMRAEHQAEAARQVTEQRQAARQRRIERSIGRAGIPVRFQHKRFDSWRAETEWQQRAAHVARRYADNFGQVLEQGTCLVLVGKPGSGKTHLACAVAQEVIETGHTAMFTSLGRLLRTIRDSYHDDAGEAGALRQFIEPDLLILDEIGVAIGRAETRQAQLMDVINARYEAVRPTILMGNLTAEEMREHLGDRIWRRITDDGAPVLALGGNE